MKKIFILYVLSATIGIGFFLTACDKKQSGITSYVNEINAIVVSISDPDYVNQHFFDVTQYADSVKFIQLETTDDNLIAQISELLFSKDFIIIADHRTASILFFDYEGNYSHKIHKRGQGAGEYLELSNVMLNLDNDIIIVHDLVSKAMLHYDFQGTHISTTREFCDGMVARDIINLPSGDYLCYRQDKLGTGKWQAGIWKARKDGSFDKFIYATDFDFKSVFVQYSYHLSLLPDNKISFVDQNLTSVFYVDEDDNVYKRVEFKLPGKTEADFPNEEDRNREGCYTIFTSQEKGDFIFTQWIDPKSRSFQTVFTKSTGKLETGLNFTPFAFGVFIPGGRFVRNNNPYISSSWFFPVVVDQFLKGNPPEELKRMAEKVIEGIPLKQIEETNPIIQLLYIKKHY